MTTGLVVGKFLPPHAGHHHLISSAVARVDHLDVWVCERDDDPIPAALRAEWLAEEHPGATVRTVVDDIPDGQGDTTSAAWADRTIELLGQAPDAVFTSEDYGPRWASFLGCQHVMVDRERRAFPVSGTAVRADPAAHWSMLAPSVRAYLVRRVCIVGAESTGTTTLAGTLAVHYGTTWVPEYGRDHAAMKVAAGEPWTSDDFTTIARRQQAAEDAAARESGPLLICDTDALATSIWHERYMDEPSPEVARIAASRSYAMYVLTSDDIPFVQDGTRDGEHLRGWMTDRFRNALAQRSEPFVEVTGSREARLAAAVSAIDSLPAMVLK
jgi:NadR type nicotinamide-nucleotide adenylyltransferase